MSLHIILKHNQRPRTGAALRGDAYRGVGCKLADVTPARIYDGEFSAAVDADRLDKVVARGFDVYRLGSSEPRYITERSDAMNETYYIIHDVTVPLGNGETADFTDAYSGPACRDAMVIPGHAYRSVEVARMDAKNLSSWVPSGFAVYAVGASEPEYITPPTLMMTKEPPADES